MEALKVHAKTDSNGKLTISLDTYRPNSELDLIIVMEDKSSGKKSVSQNEKYDLSDFVGKINWDIDPVEYQRSLRDEW